VLPPGATEPLGALLERLGAQAALTEGRVFVGGRRAADALQALSGGDVVEVHPARAAAAGVAVLAEHAGLVFVSKPPGVATEPDHAGVAASLVGRVAELLGLAPGVLHAVSRLDVGVSGVVTLARDEGGRALAADVRARGGFRRRYVALAARAPEPAHGSWDSALPRNVRGARGRAAGPASNERSAKTLYATVAEADPVYLPGRTAVRVAVRPALLALSPLTGRTHQLRLHAERAGSPLLGDAEHGGASRVLLASGGVVGLERVFLHAAWVELALKDALFRVEAAIPPELDALWATAGGAPGAWRSALEIALSDDQG
jgi:23S rRNA-/tRNA-specific pseudouridylate synthase